MVTNAENYDLKPGFVTIMAVDMDASLMIKVRTSVVLSILFLFPKAGAIAI